MVGTYTLNGKPNPNTKIVLKENGRFGFVEFFHTGTIGTSGNFQISEYTLTLHSDKQPNTHSSIEYLQPNDDDDSKLKIRVKYEDLVYNQNYVDAKVVATYGKQTRKTFYCDEDGTLIVEKEDLVSLEVTWIAGMSIKMTTTEVLSNNLMVTLLARSNGNTEFESREFLLKKNRLKELTGEKRAWKKVK